MNTHVRFHSKFLRVFLVLFDKKKKQFSLMFSLFVISSKKIHLKKMCYSKLIFSAIYGYNSGKFKINVSAKHSYNDTDMYFRLLFVSFELDGKWQHCFLASNKLFLWMHNFSFVSFFLLYFVLFIHYSIYVFRSIRIVLTQTT